MQQAGFRRFTTDLIEIQDRYWPYQRTAIVAVRNDSETYVASVRRLFLSHACVRSASSPADERLASEWYRRGIPLERVETLRALDGRIAVTCGGRVVLNREANGL